MFWLICSESLACNLQLCKFIRKWQRSSEFEGGETCDAVWNLNARKKGIGQRFRNDSSVRDAIDGWALGAKK